MLSLVRQKSAESDLMALNPPTEVDPSSRKSLLKSAGAMGVATFFSRILGLIRELVFAFLFGASDATDAFQVAFRIPNLLRDLFAEGAMSAALVPTFTRAYKEQGEARAWYLAGLVFRVLFVFTSLLAVIGIIFAPELVSLYAGAFKETAGKFELTVDLTRIMYPFFPLVALAAAFMAVLNSRHKFFMPAFSSALFNLTSIVTGLIGAFVLPLWGYHAIIGMGLGVLFGGAVQALCQLPSLYRVNYRWDPNYRSEFRWYRDPGLKQMMLLIIPGMVGLGATQINVLVNTILASSQGTGAVSYLNYAFRLMQFPIGIFGVSLAQAALPRISSAWVDRNFVSINDTLTQSLKTIFLINFLAASGLAFLGEPIIRLLFEYGKFEAADTQATAIVLAAYSVGLVGYSAVKVFVPAFYALGRTQMAVLSSILSVALTVGFNLLMIEPLGYRGLALGTSLAAIFNALILAFLLKRVLKAAGGELALRPLVLSVLQYSFVALTAGVLTYLTYQFTYEFWSSGSDVLVTRIIQRFATVFVLSAEFCLIALGVAKILGLSEVGEALNLWKKFSARLLKKN